MSDKSRQGVIRLTNYPKYFTNLDSAVSFIEDWIGIFDDSPSPIFSFETKEGLEEIMVEISSLTVYVGLESLGYYYVCPDVITALRMGYAINQDWLASDLSEVEWLRQFNWTPYLEYLNSIWTKPGE